MVQARFGHNAVLYVIEIHRREEIGILRGGLVGVQLRQVAHAGRSQANAGVAALDRLIRRVDRRIPRMEERTRVVASSGWLLRSRALGGLLVSDGQSPSGHDPDPGP